MVNDISASKDAEAEALAKLLEERQVQKNTFATQALEVTPSALGQLLKGTRPLNLPMAIKIAEHLAVPIDSFSPRLAALVRSAMPHLAHASDSVGRPAALHVASERPTNYGPFTRELQQRATRLPPSDKRLIETYALGVIESWESKSAARKEPAA